MNNENINVQTETDMSGCSANTLLAYVEACVLANMIKPAADKKPERSEN